MAPAAASAQGVFSCRASAGRSTPGSPAPGSSSEPTVANSANSPCANGDAEGLTPTTFGAASAQKVRATTRATSTSAVADVGNSGVAAGSGAQAITADTLQAHAEATCQNGAPVLSGSSGVENLRFGGVPLPLAAPDAPASYDLGPVGMLLVNQRTVSGGEITERALVLRTPSGETVTGEARAGASANPCTGAGAGSGSGSAPAADCSRAATCVQPTSTIPAISDTNQSPYVLDIVGFSQVSYECSVDGGRYRACHAPFRFRLGEGCHHIAIRGRDGRGRTQTLRRTVCVDTRAPRAALFYPLCRNTTRGSGARQKTALCAAKARYWQLLRGVASDPGPSSGLRSVEVNVVQRRAGACRGVAGGRLVQMSCATASRTWVAAGSAGWRSGASTPAACAGAPAPDATSAA